MSRPHFDLVHSPITGRILVEASAGTGKTFTIAALVVRLIVEAKREIEQILVVTFTEAATAELRDRIRRRLIAAIDYFTEGSGDDFLAALAQKVPDRDDARRRLQRALINFDQAAIHTIHGFCQRLLQDRAFEARALFDTELVTDLTSFEQQLADDFWRMRSPAFGATFADYLIDRKFGPDRLYQLQRNARRAERILPETPAPDLATVEGSCVHLLNHLAAVWSREHEAIVADLLNCAPGMHKISYTPSKIEDAVQQLDRFFATGSLWGAHDAIKKFSSPKANKGRPVPSHPFFADCAAFAAAREELQGDCHAALLALQRDFLLWRDGEAQRRKSRLNMRTFDDLLSEVATAVQSSGSGGLLQGLQSTYRAILIDEFQDTDPVQYAIFGTLCPDDSRTLFLIGDPKQAIYSFRGADIFTYLAAARHVDHHYTLGVNYRSAPLLVDAVSHLFARENPFLFSEIPYPEVVGSERNRSVALLEKGKDEHPPLHLWFLDRPDGKAEKKEKTTERIVAGVAAEIVHLLRSGARLRLEEGKGERTLTAGDIAVLVRSNRQAAAVQEALLSCGVPAIRQGTESLFSAPEVEVLLRTLAAIADPAETFLVRGALASGLFDYEPSAILLSVDDPATLDHWLQRLRDYHELWQRRGITALSGALFEQEMIGARFMVYRDGERRLTNLRHAFEVLHCAESREGLGMTGLLAWFSRQIADPPEGEEYQLRLETDERAVQVVTIHRSKGLEYPVCFVPFCWNSSRPTAKFKNDPFTFHAQTEEGRGELTLDLGSPDEERELYRSVNIRENLAENLRLLYVAVTRAKARLYLLWGGLKDAGSSAPAWLLHGPQSPAAGAEVEGTEQLYKELGDEDLRARLLPLVDGGRGEIVPIPLDPHLERLQSAGDESLKLAPLPSSPVIHSDWRLSSYSAMIVGSHHLADGEVWQMSERVESEGGGSVAEEDESGVLTIHAFPRGADPGSVLHDIFEVIDFAAEEVDLRVVEKSLNSYAIDLVWVPVVAAMIQSVLRAPLSTERAELQLCRVGRSERCSEMGFFLPVTELRAAALTEVFARHRQRLPDARIVSTIAGLNFETVSGMLRGFIDLVFRLEGRYYLLDWKSNHLGPSSSAYTAQRMSAEMLSSGYVLQYHLYCVALHRHLRRTLPGYDYERDFGGVFYLFLRGVDASGTTGIYRDRPDLALIEDLDELMRGGDV